MQIASQPPGPKPELESDPVSRLLADCARGEGEAFGQLMVEVYDDLRRIAHRRLAEEREGHTLSTTALVHEAYLQLVSQATASWRDRAHFFAVAARVIRHVLIDYGRARNAEKRGGGAIHVPLDMPPDGVEGEAPRTVELLALDEALQELWRRDPRLERVVECRFFGGMTMQDTAEALGVSLRTAERDWTRAKAYLFHALQP
jgi:RNA polymerase sigma factor (TIGR02999 family)